MAEAIAFASRVTAEWSRGSAPAQALWLHWAGGSARLEEPVCVGADEANQVVLDDRHVSAFHCRLHAREGRWLVTDLGSTNGTFLDGARIAEAELDAGARIRVGSQELRVEAPPARTAASMPGLLARDPALGPALELLRRAAPSPASSPRPSCSDTRRARSPAPSPARPEPSGPRTAGRSFSTRSPTCPRRCK
jgi:predicted component of type VI protein secretion system